MAVSNTNMQPLLHHFFMIIILFSQKTPSASSLSFNFTSFSSNNNDITYEIAFPQNQVIQLASRTAMIGRATYSRPMRLWQNSTSRLTDFTTHFSFVIDSDKRTGYEDGIAFFLAPQDSKIPNVTKGGSLGLTNDGEEINSTSNPFVAVEFDINTNPWDPPREHVGIDINSMRSSSNVTWWSNSSIREGRMNEAWINYNSSTQNLSVVFTGFRDNATVMQYLEYKVDLRLYLPEVVTFGFSAATGNASAIHTVHSWEFSSSLEVDEFFFNTPGQPSSEVDDNFPNTPRKPRIRSRGSNKKIRVAVGSSVGGGASVVGLILVWLFGFRGSKDGDEEEEEKTGPKKFSYEELARATNDFSDENKLGQGGFGGVYKGFLKDTNSYIAVKVSKGSKQGTEEYASEVTIISRLKHSNLVQLLGWCHEKEELLLVYEFMPNGSLDSHLFEEDSLLTWKMRYKIAQDLASGLLYLHEEWEQCIVHKDIKSSNIMLDSNFNAKIGDFGIARLGEHPKGSRTTVMAGEMGYMTPECCKTGKAIKETDVYSFGTVVLEIACGRKPINPKAEEGQVYMVQWVWELYGSEKLLEAADPRLCKEFDERQMKQLMIVGLWCAHPDENLRPSIGEAIQVLNFEAELPILPPKMPSGDTVLR